jgi:hypothetical protein
VIRSGARYAICRIPAFGVHRYLRVLSSVLLSYGYRPDLDSFWKLLGRRVYAVGPGDPGAREPFLLGLRAAGVPVGPDSPS